jgi:hypothetical protein
VKYAVIVWETQSEALTGKGTVYDWYATLGEAVKVALTLRRTHWHAVAVEVF